jgi:hypothetical protein
LGDEKNMFKVAILTISDRGSTGERKDASGPLIQEMVKDLPGEVIHYEIIPQEGDREALKTVPMGADLILPQEEQVSVQEMSHPMRHEGYSTRTCQDSPRPCEPRVSGRLPMP